MRKRHSKTKDKQLVKLELARLAKKRELDQAFNIKELAVLSDVSYALARSWFHQPGFPVIRGVVFWSDFVEWRKAHSGLTAFLEQVKRDARKSGHNGETTVSGEPMFTGKAAQILAEIGGPEMKFTGRAAAILREAQGH